MMVTKGDKCVVDQGRAYGKVDDDDVCCLTTLLKKSTGRKESVRQSSSEEKKGYDTRSDERLGDER